MWIAGLGNHFWSAVKSHILLVIAVPVRGQEFSPGLHMRIRADQSIQVHQSRKDSIRDETSDFALWFIVETHRYFYEKRCTSGRRSIPWGTVMYLVNVRRNVRRSERGFLIQPRRL